MSRNVTVTAPVTTASGANRKTAVAMRLSPFQSLVTALVPDYQRGQMMSAAIACGQGGMAIGAGVAGIIYGSYGLAGNAVAGAVFILLMAVVVVRGLPEPKADPQPVVVQGA